MLTDTHCHLDFHQFDEDRQAVLQRARDAGIIRMLVPGLDWDSSLAALSLAGSHPHVFAAAGYHPTDVEKWDEASYVRLKELILGSQTLQEPAAHQKIVAIGEIGLDYYWVKEPARQAYQRAILKQQLQLAAEVSKPVVIHMREADDAWLGPASLDLLEILAEWQASLRKASHPLAERPRAAGS